MQTEPPPFPGVYKPVVNFINLAIVFVLVTAFDVLFVGFHWRRDMAAFLVMLVICHIINTVAHNRWARRRDAYMRWATRQYVYSLRDAS